MCIECAPNCCVADFKSDIKFNYIEDCPFTVEDIDAAEKIFRQDIHALKGKTVRKAPYQVKVNTIAVPQEVLELHKTILFIRNRFFFVNGLVFFITVSNKIKFITVEYVTAG